jgi:Photoprotection regulator fluorescence recovery protein
MRYYDWSNTEKILARQAYDRAYERECTEILGKLRGMLSGMEDPKEIWKIDDYLRKHRRDMDSKYDYRYSILIIVFGKLMRDGLIFDSDIDKLSQDKIDAIKRIASI